MLEPRVCRLGKAEFVPRSATRQYCSRACGVRHPASRVPRPETRKVARPPYDQPMAELSAGSFCAVARRHGVSDNAVRKWVGRYEAERERGDEPPGSIEQSAA